ncbi:MAG: peptidoglycan DD-metalloendopeptidase family protein [bacterium]|nr:peptidoglycan DD-metalloendopeptidase family protein [bacterium]
MKITRNHPHQPSEPLHIPLPRVPLLIIIPIVLILISGLGYRILTPVTTSSFIFLPSAPELKPVDAEPGVLSAELILEEETAPFPGNFAESPTRPGDSLTLIEGSVKAREGLTAALTTAGLDQEMIKLIENRLAPILNFRTCRPGDRFKASINAEGNLTEFDYESDPMSIFRVFREGDGYLAEKVLVQPDLRVANVAGEVSSSLFEALVSAGESAQLAMDFADLLAWDMDFSTETRSGDKFRILVEKLYLEGKFYQYGRVLAAEYQNGGETYTAIFYEDPQGRGDYYDQEGKSLRRAFLKSPLKFARISSKFTHRRFHPVLKIFRPHLGVDYAAPRGTPIWAIGDGTIAARGWMGGAGKAVRIKHPNGFVTSYGHLSQFARGIRPGVKVKQQQVIGYVGATGLATGPHLDFRVKKNGRFINPLSIQGPRALSVDRAFLADFNLHRQKIAQAFNTPDPTSLLARAPLPPARDQVSLK